MEAWRSGVRAQAEASILFYSQGLAVAGHGWEAGRRGNAFPTGNRMSTRLCAHMCRDSVDTGGNKMEPHCNSTRGYGAWSDTSSISRDDNSAHGRREYYPLPA